MPDEQQKVKEEELQEALAQRVTDFKHSFETPSGKRVYEYLSKFCFENQSSFDVSSRSNSVFQEGSRYVILEIKKWLEFDLTKGVNL